MKKLIALAVMAAACSPSTFAQVSNFDGFSASLAVGSQKTESPSRALLVDGADIGYKVGASSASATTTVGSINYTTSIDKQFTLGYDLSMNLAKLKAGTATFYDNGTADGSSAVKMDSSYTISLVPGYLIDSSTMVYGKVGYTTAKISNKDNSDGATEKLTFNGYSYGVGLKKLIEKNLFFFGEANMTKLNEKEWNGKSDGGALLKQKIKGDTTSFLVGIGYKF